MARADQSRTVLAQRALSRIEAETIADFDEDTPEAREARLHFEAVRDRLLQAVDWNFARRGRVLPARSDITPPFGGGFYVTPPPDFLVGRQINGQEGIWQAEADGLRVSTVPAELIYTAVVADSTAWSPLFEGVFVAGLALALAPTLADASASRISVLQGEVRDLLDEARSSNGLEGAPGELDEVPWNRMVLV